MKTWTSRPLYRPIGLPWLLLLASACGSTHEVQSGETHFLRWCSDRCEGGLQCVDAVCTRSCKQDDACTALGERASCEPSSMAEGEPARVCDLACTRDEDCSALGSGFKCEIDRCRDLSTTPPDGGALCARGCSPVYGYAEDPARECVDRSERKMLACDCEAAAAFSRCIRDVTDDRLWVVHASDDAVASRQFERCTFDELPRVEHACEFEHCAHPPLSICTPEATCRDRGCDNLEYFVDGCRRAPCSDDSACANDERCVQLECTSTSACTMQGLEETCGCGGPGACIAGGACTGVYSAGPRGAWQLLELIEGSTMCPAETCLSVYQLAANGALIVKLGTEDPDPKTVSVAERDLTEIRMLIDGPELRRQLRDGFECQLNGRMVADSFGTLRLQLEDQTLERPIERCIEVPDALGRLRALLANYR